MCGIAGIISRTQVDESLLASFAGALRHRGPDDSHTWTEDGVGLVHTRLSIIDLSPLGRQPMVSRSANTVLSFNGEIYNFQELRQELEHTGVVFRSRSDSEVLLEACELWGIEQTLIKLRGMFAFACWNRKTRKLSLVRDRAGKKPLYYGWRSADFVFASELGALLSIPRHNFQVDPSTAALLFRHNYIPAPHSVLQGIYKLPPSSFLELDLEALHHKPNTFSQWPDESQCGPRRYWFYPTSLSHSSPIEKRSDQDVLHSVRDLLQTAIRRRMIADVPLGAFLSGGIDSSLVVGTMQRLSGTPVKTFTIGFHEQEFNEAGYASKVAQHFGTEHTELYVDMSEAQSVIPLLPSIFSEPFSDSSQLPTFLVSKLASKHVKVALSGDAGDELFYGYSRYPAVAQLAGSLGRLSPRLRRALGSMLQIVPSSVYNSLAPLQSLLLRKDARITQLGRRAHTLARAMQADSPNRWYLEAVSHWRDLDKLIPGVAIAETELERSFTRLANLPFPERMTHFDLLSYLPDDILTKVDLSSMANSLEVRVPFLDQELVEFACSLSIEQRTASRGLKGILKHLLEDLLPVELFQRPKMGFAIPLADWLRTDLRDWAETLLENSTTSEGGLFNAKAIAEKWTEHQRGTHDWHYLLWDILIFEQWRAHYKL